METRKEDFSGDNNGGSIKELHAKSLQGDAQVQIRIGLMFTAGRGGKENRAEAVRWFLRAAEQGNAEAQYKLGEIYEKGDCDVAKDKSKAFLWYKKAAHLGHAEAQERKQQVLNDIRRENRAVGSSQRAKSNSSEIQKSEFGVGKIIGLTCVLFFFVILPMCNTGNRGTDGIFESATEELNRNKINELTKAEKQRLDDVYFNWCKKCNKPLRHCPHG